MNTSSCPWTILSRTRSSNSLFLVYLTGFSAAFIGAKKSHLTPGGVR